MELLEEEKVGELFAYLETYRNSLSEDGEIGDAEELSWYGYVSSVWLSRSTHGSPLSPFPGIPALPDAPAVPAPVNTRRPQKAACNGRILGDKTQAAWDTAA